MRARDLVKGAGAALLALSMLGPCASADAAGEGAPRFYVGAALAASDYEGEHEGLRYGDAPLAAQLHGGVQVSERWSVELALHRLDADSGDIAGSGTARLEIADRLDIAVVRAVLRIPLSELFGWQRRLAIFGTGGLHRSEWRREVVDLRSGEAQSRTLDDTGFALGGGILYGIGRLHLRGYVERFELDRVDPTRELGVGVEIRF